MEDQAPSIGHNIGDQDVDHGQEVIERLRIDYRPLLREVAETIAEADKLPAVVNSDDELNSVAKIIQRFRDLYGRLESFRKTEKEPYLRKGEAVDQVFMAEQDKISARKKGDTPGVANELQARNTAYLQRKEDEERQRREEIARKAREEAAAIEKAQAEERRKAEAARVAADEAAAKAARARNADNIKAAEEAAAAARKAAAEATAAAEAMNQTVVNAQQNAIDASIETNRSAADLARTRGEGTLSTLKMEGYAEIKEGEGHKLDAKLLWPYVPAKAREQALSAWAKANDYAVQMDGAIIGKRRKGVTR